MGFDDAWSGYEGENQHSPMPLWIRRGIVGGLGAMFGYGAAGAAGVAGAAGGAAPGEAAGSFYGSALGSGGMDFPWGSVISGAMNLFGGNQANQANQEMSDAQRLWQTQMQFQNQLWNADQAAMTRDWTAGQAGITRDFSAQQAEVNRQFQERMSNTQYQRAVGDMQAAGLNPMLGYSQGGAGNVGGSTATASTPSGAQASSGGVGASPVAHFQNVIGPAVSTALQSATTMASLENIAADTGLKRNQAIRELADSDLKKLYGRESTARAIIEESEGRVRQYGEGYRKYREDLAAQMEQGRVFSEFQRGRREAAEADISEYGRNKARAYSDYYGSAAGRASPYVDQGLELVKSITGAFANSAFGLRALGAPGRGMYGYSPE